MTKITDEKQRAFASAAHSLLQSQAFKDASESIERHFSERWKTAADTESREAVFHEYNGLRAIIARLREADGAWQMHLEATKET